MDELRDLLKRSNLPPAETFCMSSLEVRVDNFHRVESFRKSIKIRVLPLNFVFFSRPFDVLRLRFRTESRKPDNPEFSTFAQIICGRQWKSPRLVAFAVSVQELSPAKCG